MQPRMSMITLGVTDLTRAIRFYEALGFPRYGNDDSVAFFKLNGTWLSLYPRDALADDAQVDATGSGFNAFTIAHNVASEADVHQVIEEAKAAGAEIVKAPEKVFWGGYSGYFKDPDGFLWEVAMNPFTWIGPADDNKL